MKLSLVDNDTIELEILSSRLALTMMDRASSEFTDLRSRINFLERHEELEANDILRPQVLARLMTSSWLRATLTLDDWRVLQPVLHEELSVFAQEAYHDTNRWLLQHGVMPEVDLRPLIRRAQDAAGDTPAWTASVPDRRGGMVTAAVGAGSGGDTGAAAGGRDGRRRSSIAPEEAVRPDTDIRTEVGDETRMMTRAGGMVRGPDPAEAVIGRLNRLVGRHLPGFSDTSRNPPPASPGLSAAIGQAQQGIVRRLTVPSSGGVRSAVSTPQLLEELAAAQAGAEAGRGDAGRARDDRDRRAAVPEHPDRGHDPGRGARLVRAAADAGACASRCRSRISSRPSTIRRAA